MVDEAGLYRLALMLNSTNLPAERQGIAEILNQSCASFEGRIQNPLKRLYVFVLEDTRTGAVIGSSQIIACHGTPELPHIYFQVETLHDHSETLGENSEQQILRLGFDREGYTELGGLILDPKYRHVPYKLGRALSLIRFWFIGHYKHLFKERLLAELLPPEATEQSPLWQALGSHFTKLSYQQADHLSRKQKEFIEELFPEYPIYISLLPQKAQEVIGQVGDGSKPACHLLANLGFKFENRVDPFDGGPHLEMKTADLPAVSLNAEISFERPFEPGASLRAPLAESA